MHARENELRIHRHLKMRAEHFILITITAYHSFHLMITTVILSLLMVVVLEIIIII
jgi:hypothetical protein